jgi:restriction endonuclease Mrr
VDAISKWTPQEFEELVIAVLHALGYGLSRDALQRVGRSGDGGSGPARDAAKQARGSVVLIDRRRLAEIMIERGVGVTSEQLVIPRIDTDCFGD